MARRARRGSRFFMPEGLHVLTLRGGEIEEIMAFRSPEVFPSFDLPASIAA
jgi:hypothetical protein